MPGRGRGSASQAGLGSNSGRAKVAGIAGYHSRPMVAPLQPDPEKLAAIRAALPATGAGIYLNTGTSGPLPAATVRAMRELEDWEERVGRADPAGWDAFLERMDECRGVLAALLSAGPESIALTHSTTDGMNIATWGVDWRPGDPALIQERIAAAMTPRTRLVSLSHVLWTTGAVLPVVEIGRIARERGAWYAVDAAQSAGAILVDAEAIGADFIAFPGQKWLLGPEGTGALWASPRAVAEALPVTAGWLSFATLDAHARGDRWPDARRFEATNYHKPSTVGLARSVGWLEMHVGLAWAFERAGRIARATAARLAAVPGVTLVTPQERMATLVSFRVQGWTPLELRKELSRRVFAITRTVAAVDALRISVGFFNSEDELERFAEAVAELARHTPAPLPRRPALVMLPSDAAPGA